MDSSLELWRVNFQDTIRCLGSCVGTSSIVCEEEHNKLYDDLGHFSLLECPLMSSGCNCVFQQPYP